MAMKRYLKKRTKDGFSLVEVLVAIAILAIVSAAVYRQGIQSLGVSNELSLKSRALWIIEERLSAIENNEFPEVGATSIDLEREGMVIITDVAQTSDVDLRKVDVSLYRKNGASVGSEILSMTTFKGRY